LSTVVECACVSVRSGVADQLWKFCGEFRRATDGGVVRAVLVCMYVAVANMEVDGIAGVVQDEEVVGWLDEIAGGEEEGGRELAAAVKGKLVEEVKKFMTF